MPSLATAINDALARCNRAGGIHRLPDDYDCFPILQIDDAGQCVGLIWRARIGEHLGSGSSPALATYGVCRGPIP